MVAVSPISLPIEYMITDGWLMSLAIIAAVGAPLIGELQRGVPGGFRSGPHVGELVHHQHSQLVAGVEHGP